MFNTNNLFKKNQRHLHGFTIIINKFRLAFSLILSLLSLYYLRYMYTHLKECQ